MTGRPRRRGPGTGARGRRSPSGTSRRRRRPRAALAAPGTRRSRARRRASRCRRRPRWPRWCRRDGPCGRRARGAGGGRRRRSRRGGWARIRRRPHQLQRHDRDRGLRVERVLQRDAHRRAGDPDVAARVDRAGRVPGGDEQVGDEVDELPLARGPDVEHDGLVQGRDRAVEVERRHGRRAPVAGPGSEAAAGVVAEVVEGAADEGRHPAAVRDPGEGEQQVEQRGRPAAEVDGTAGRGEPRDGEVGAESRERPVVLRHEGVDPGAHLELERPLGRDPPDGADGLEGRDRGRRDHRAASLRWRPAPDRIRRPSRATTPTPRRRPARQAACRPPRPRCRTRRRPRSAGRWGCRRSP